MPEAERPEGASQLAGLEVLVVEDETLVSFLIEDMLTELGCAVVRHASGVRDAIALLDARRPDAAVLDVNLGGENVDAVAERLDRDGIPFVFASGYGREGIGKAWSRVPVVQKPFALEALGRALRSVLGSRPPPA
jgi:CheY-like chemotaxis protein